MEHRVSIVIGLTTSSFGLEFQFSDFELRIAKILAAFLIPSPAGEQQSPIYYAGSISH